MRFIFVNYSHPAVNHISGVRLREFARAFARRGHEVVLISSTLPGGDVALAPEGAARKLTTHHWQEPLHVACAPKPNRWLGLARDGRLPAPLRRAVSLWSLTLGDGPWHDWVAGSKPYWPLLADQFKPDFVWANFGSLSDLVLAQALARRAGAPWCADIKDNMHAFLPAPVHPFVRRRFSDVAGLTANARFHAQKSMFEGPHEVVYSGVDEALTRIARLPVPRDCFRVTLVGSIYSWEALASYLRGFDLFLSRLTAEQQSQVELCYAGNETQRVRDAVSRSSRLIRLVPLGYLSPSALCDAYARSAVASYIWAGSGFHHKTVEMLVTNRPVVSFPDEFAESRAIAGAMGAPLHSPKTSDELAGVLSGLHSRWLEASAAGNALATDAFTWDAGAEALERTFDRIVRARSTRSRATIAASIAAPCNVSGNP